jgi:hypothetical protein
VPARILDLLLQISEWRRGHTWKPDAAATAAVDDDASLELSVLPLPAFLTCYYRSVSGGATTPGSLMTRLLLHVLPVLSYPCSCCLQSS